MSSFRFSLLPSYFFPTFYLAISRFFALRARDTFRYTQKVTRLELKAKRSTKIDLRSFVTRVLFRYDTTRCKDRRLITCVFYSVEIENSNGW